MYLTSTADITLGQAGLYGILGYATIFLGLLLLMTVIIVIGKFFTANENKKAAVGDDDHIVPEVAPAAAPNAPGSAGGVKLYNVEPKTAAMLMAIVADKLQKPVNELRFISIKEVSE